MLTIRSPHDNFLQDVVSWNIAIALAVLAFALPFLILYIRVEEQRKRCRNERTENDYLRRMLKDSERHVQNDKSLFLEALGVPFLLVRPSGRLVMANSTACELLGVDATVHTNLLKFLPPGPLRDVIKTAVAAESTEEESITLKVKAEERRFRVTAKPLGNADKHVGIVLHDVTAEYRTQVIRRDFVANASHELRTPLTILRGYLETLLEDEHYAANEQRRTRSLEVMKKHADRITRLVEDMLTVSRLETAHELRLNCEPLDLRSVLDDVYLRLESMLLKQKACLQVELSPQPFIINGDKFYWSQIFFNLLENALKNNPDAAITIRVSAELLPPSEARVCVEDNGRGILADALPFVFNRFYRADVTGKVKGTGLGLSIVKHAVEAHGGHIFVESEPGVSTRFVMTLPLSDTVPLDEF